MSSEFERRYFDPRETRAVDVFVEGRKSKTLVGRLTREEDNNGVKNYKFAYDEKYLHGKKALPLGPELPLTKREFTSNHLFTAFRDRIPSKDNPAFPEYCEKFGISPTEDDELILLVTIASRGPSSFVFEPVFGVGFTGEDMKAFRHSLGLSTREFAAVFDVSLATVVNIENGLSTGRDVLKRIELYRKFPQLALYELEKNSSKLHKNLRESVMEFEAIRTYVENFNKGREEINKATASLRNYSNLVNIVVKYSYVIEKRVVLPKQKVSEGFVKSILSKMGHELMGFLACFNNGSLMGMFHILRSIMEVNAAISYVRAKEEKRLKKWNAYETVVKHVLFQKLGTKVQLTEDEQIELNLIRSRQPSEEEISRLKLLFSISDQKKQTLADVRTWHHPAKIDNMIDEMEMPVRTRKFYDQFSNLVHFSPLGIKTTGYSLLLTKDKIRLADDLGWHFAYFIYSISKQIEPWVSQSLFQELGPILEHFDPKLAQKK